MVEHARGIQKHYSLVGKMHPFHLDAQGKIPGLITNGSIGKKPYAEHIGCPIINNVKVTEATGHAENTFHTIHGDSVIGPYYLEGIPYPLNLALEKLKAGIQVLTADSQLESFFTNDTTYRLLVPGRLDVTVHKPKKEEDIERLSHLLYEASQVGAHLMSVSGTARYDERTHEIELYSTETDMGEIRQFDMVQLTNRLRHNSSISMGTKTYEAMNFLVDRPKTLTTVVTRYSGGTTENGDTYKFEGPITPLESQAVEVSADDNVWIQLAGLGFFPL